MTATTKKANRGGRRPMTITFITGSGRKIEVRDTRRARETWARAAADYVIGDCTRDQADARTAKAFGISKTDASDLNDKLIR